MTGHPTFKRVWYFALELWEHPGSTHALTHTSQLTTEQHKDVVTQASTQNSCKHTRFPLESFSKISATDCGSSRNIQH